MGEPPRGTGLPLHKGAIMRTRQTFSGGIVFQIRLGNQRELFRKTGVC